MRTRPAQSARAGRGRTWASTDQKGGDHASAFSGEHVERACRGSIVHHLDADAAGQAGGHDGGRGEAQAFAAAEQDHGGFEAQYFIKVFGLQFADQARTPVLDQAVGGEDEAGLEALFVDQGVLAAGAVVPSLVNPFTSSSEVGVVVHVHMICGCGSE